MKKEFSGRCYICNRTISWAEGQSPCCDDCLPVRLQNQAQLSKSVQMMKERDKERARRETAEGFK